MSYQTMFWWAAPLGMSRSLLKFALRPSPDSTLRSYSIRCKTRGAGVLFPQCSQRLAQHRQLLVSLQSPEPLGRLLHRRTGPAQRHRPVAPVLHVAAYPPDAAHHVLDDVGAG